MAYYATKILQPIGSYYGGTAQLPVSGSDVVAMTEAGCPRGYHQGNLTAGGVSLETPVCVKNSFNALHLGVAAVVGLVIGKML